MHLISSNRGSVLKRQAKGGRRHRCGYALILAACVVSYPVSCWPYAGLWPGLTTARTAEQPGDFSDETELDFFNYFYKASAPRFRSPTPARRAPPSCRPATGVYGSCRV